MKNGKKELKVSLELSDFNVPPYGDILVLGKRSPIGMNAAEKMLTTVAFENFSRFDVDDDVIEGMFINKRIFRKVTEDVMVKYVLDRVKDIMDDEFMITIKCNLSVNYTEMLVLDG